MVRKIASKVIFFLAAVVALPGMFFFMVSEILEELAFKLKGKEMPLEE